MGIKIQKEESVDKYLDIKGKCGVFIFFINIFIYLMVLNLVDFVNFLCNIVLLFFDMFLCNGMLNEYLVIVFRDIGCNGVVVCRDLFCDDQFIGIQKVCVFVDGF